MQGKVWHIGLASVAAAALMAWPVHAAAAPAVDEAAPEGRQTIVDEGVIIVTAPQYVPQTGVTATKTAIPLIATPQSISIITRDQIDLLNFNDLQQAVRYTAGVSGETYGPDLRFDFITVRGFTPKQFIDGLAAPISTSIYSVGVDLYAFEQVEILKGPASVLYGTAPPGGIFNQVSRRASDETGGEIRVQGGTWDYFQLATTLNAPVSDKLDVRFTGLYLDRGAERDLVGAQRVLVAPTATWKISDKDRLTGLFYYQWDRVTGDTNGFLPVYGTLLPNPIGKVDRSTNLGDPDNVFERSQYGIGWEYEHDISDAVAFRSNAKWSYYDENTPTGVYGGGGLINITDPGDPSYFRTVSRYNFSYSEQVRSFAFDNRLDASVETGAVAHKLLGGVDYRNVGNDASYGFVGAGTIDLFDPQYPPLDDPRPGYPFAFNNQRLVQTGLYGQDQLQFGNFFLLLGGRYDWVTVTNFATDTDTNQSAFTWRVGANYVADNGIAPYISYATSFEPVLGVDSVTGQDFKPSTGRQIEAGIKWDGRALPKDIKLFVTAAIFDIRQTNLVSTTPSVTPVFGTQSGEVEVYGGEIEFVARIRDQWAINGAYSYTHSEVTENDDFPAQVGAPLPVTPAHKFALLVDYTIQRGPLGGLGFALGGRYASGSAGSLPGPFNPVVYEGESSTLFDAIIHYDTPGWRFSLNGSNIADTTYVARCSGPAGCTYGAGRQVIFTVTRKL